MFWAVCFKETVDSIKWNRSGSELQALGPKNEKARSPKIVRRMYHEVEAERRPKTCMSTSIFSNELHGVTNVRQTAASVDEMHQQTELELKGLTSVGPHIEGRCHNRGYFPIKNLTVPFVVKPFSLTGSHVVNPYGKAVNAVLMATKATKGWLGLERTLVRLANIIYHYTVFLIHVAFVISVQ